MERQQCLAGVEPPDLDGDKVWYLNSLGVLLDLVLLLDNRLLILLRAPSCKVAPYSGDLAMLVYATLKSKLDYCKILYTGRPSKKSQQL